MKTDSERGVYGRWLVRARKERDLPSQVKAREAMAAAGIIISQSVYAEYESGTKVPSKSDLPLLIQFFDSAPEPLEGTESGDPLEDALSVLSAELLASQESLSARLRAVEAELQSLRVRPRGGGSVTRFVPRKTGE